MILDFLGPIFPAPGAGPKIWTLSPAELSTLAVGAAGLIVAVGSAWFSRVSANAARAATDVAARALDRQRESEAIAHRDAYYKLLVVDPSITAVREFLARAHDIVANAATLGSPPSEFVFAENTYADGGPLLEAMDELNGAYFTLRADLLLGVDAWVERELSDTVTTELDRLQDVVAERMEQASQRGGDSYGLVRLALHDGGVRVIRALMLADPALGPQLRGTRATTHPQNT